MRQLSCPADRAHATARTLLPTSRALAPLARSGHSPPTPYSPRASPPTRRLAAYAPVRTRLPTSLAPILACCTPGGRSRHLDLIYGSATRVDTGALGQGTAAYMVSHGWVHRPSGSPPSGFAAVWVRRPPSSPPSELDLQQSRRFTASAAQVAQRSRVATRSALRSLKSRLKCEVEAKLIKLAKLVLEEVFGPVPCQARRVAIEAVVRVN